MSSPAKKTPRFDGLSVLLVEDEEALRRLLARSLSSLGFAEVHAVGGADAARKLVEDGLRVDLLFTDIRMPGSVDGLELARWIRKRDPRLPILLQTGFAEEDAPEFAVLEKPFNRERLALAIASAIQRSSSTSEDLGPRA